MSNNKGLSFADDEGLSIPTIITKPNSIKYHWIEDKELEAIMKINAPISKIISIGCLGYIFGQISTILQLIEKNIFDKSDITSSIIIAVALAGFIITGIYSLIGKSKIDKILDDIRSRESTLLKEQNDSKK